MIDALHSWINDPARIAHHREYRHEAVAGWWLATGIYTVILLVKVAWQERLPLLALQCSSHVVLAQGMLLLLKLRPDVHDKYREFIISTGGAHHTWMMLRLVLGGGFNLFQYHGGSTLRLLCLLCLCNPSAWIAFYEIYSHLPLNYLTWALPVLALQPLLKGNRLCLKLLEEPGIQKPLQLLYGWLGMAHGVSILDPSLAARGNHDSHFQCLVINSWSIVVVAVLLTLNVLTFLRRQERMRRIRRQADLSEQQRQRRLIDEQQASGPLLLQFYLSSCLVWAVCIHLVPIVYGSSSSS